MALPTASEEADTTYVLTAGESEVNPDLTAEVTDQIRVTGARPTGAVSSATSTTHVGFISVALVVTRWTSVGPSVMPAVPRPSPAACLATPTPQVVSVTPQDEAALPETRRAGEIPYTLVVTVLVREPPTADERDVVLTG